MASTQGEDQRKSSFSSSNSSDSSKGSQDEEDSESTASETSEEESSHTSCSRHTSESRSSEGKSDDKPRSGDESSGTSSLHDGESSEGEIDDGVSQHSDESSHSRDAEKYLPPEERLSNSHKIAVKYHHTSKGDKSILAYIRCIALCRLIYGVQHWRVAEAHANLAQAYWQVKQYTEQARMHAELAKNLLTSAVPASEEQQKLNRWKILLILNSIHLIMLQVLTRNKNYEQAKLHITKCQNILKELENIEEIKKRAFLNLKLTFLQASAKMYEQQGQFARAECAYGEALKLAKKLFGEESERLIEYYQSVGRCNISDEDNSDVHLDHGLKMNMRAQSIAKAKFASPSKEVGEATQVLGRAYRKVGDTDSAAALLKESLSEFISVFGKSHASSISVQDDLAHMMVQIGKHMEAISLLRGTLQHRCEAFGDYSENVSTAYKLIGSIFLSQGDLQCAIKWFNECLLVEELVYGAKHKQTKATQKAIDVILKSPSVARTQASNKRNSRPPFTATFPGTSNLLGGFK